MGHVAVVSRFRTDILLHRIVGAVDTQGQIVGLTKLDVSLWVPLHGIGSSPLEVTVGDAASVATEAVAAMLPPTLPPTAEIESANPLSLVYSYFVPVE